MFDSRVNVILRKLALKLAVDDDEDRLVRLVNCTFTIPVIDYARALHIPRVPIVAHCFTEDGLPRWDVHGVTFDPPDELFLATLQPAPDAPPTAIFEALRVVKVRVFRAKPKTRDLTLEFATSHELRRGDARDLADAITAWEAGLVTLTLQTVQIPLELPADDAQPDADAQPRLRDRNTH